MPWEEKSFFEENVKKSKCRLGSKSQKYTWRLKKCEKYKTETKKTSAECHAAHSTNVLRRGALKDRVTKFKNFTLEPRLAKTNRIAQGKTGVK